MERQLYLDPLLLVKGKEQVAGILKQWEQSGAAIESSHLTAYRSAMNRSEKIMANTWDAYYGFEFEKALKLLAEMEKLISISGDTALRADMAFERYILEGMVLRAMERKGYRSSFASAAASARYPSSASSFTARRDSTSDLVGTRLMLFPPFSVAAASCL